MVGCIEAINSGVKSASVELSSDFFSVSALSDAERTRWVQPRRSNALRCASAAQAVHSRVYGGCTAEAAASEASGPRVSGCTQACIKHFRPHPVAHEHKAIGAFGLQRRGSS